MKRNKTDCDLQSCSLCKGCLKEWLPALNANRKTFSFKKGELLFNEGEQVKGVYFLLSGKAKVHKKWGEEKELIVRFAGPGDVVGHRGLGKEMIFPVSGSAMEASTACFVELDFFLTTLKVNHDYAYNLLMFYAEELQESEKRMRNFAHMTVKNRIAYALLQLKEKFGVTDEGIINITLSRQDLASYTGTTYETVFRTLTELSNESLISFADKNISIINDQQLSNLL